MPRLVVILALVASGCGDHADVLLRLVEVSGDDPFAGVDSLHATLSHDGDELASATAGPDGEFELGHFDRPPFVDATIEGRTAGAVVALGAQRVFMPSAGLSCCVTVCFCSIAVRNDGRCNCGSAECATACP